MSMSMIMSKNKSKRKSMIMSKSETVYYQVTLTTHKAYFMLCR